MIVRRWAPWDSDYSQGGADSIWGAPCCLYDEIINQLPKGAQVLDAGCGDGRHSLLFAQRGFRVTAVDISPNAIDKLRLVARHHAIKLTTVLDDIANFRPDHPYDLVLAHGLLHQVPKFEGRRLVDRFKRVTRVGGYNVVVVITNRVALPSYTCKYMPAPFNDGELRWYYKDWSLLVDEAYERPQMDRVPYRRHFNRVVARCTA